MIALNCKLHNIFNLKLVNECARPIKQRYKQHNNGKSGACPAEVMTLADHRKETGGSDARRQGNRAYP